MSLTYADVESYVSPLLTITPAPLLLPGPASASNQQRKSPQAIAFLAVGGGAGLSNEQLYDRVFITVSTAGRQQDYAGAEALALAVDDILLGVASPKVLGATRVLYITRAGGRPQLYQQDDGDRYWFSCTYITEASRASSL